MEIMGKPYAPTPSTTVTECHIQTVEHKTHLSSHRSLEKKIPTGDPGVRRSLHFLIGSQEPTLCSSAAVLASDFLLPFQKRRASLLLNADSLSLISPYDPTIILQGPVPHTLSLSFSLPTSLLYKPSPLLLLIFTHCTLQPQEVSQKKKLEAIF